jgi:hypothetical protein
MDVVPTSGGHWLAKCDCGLTDAYAQQPDAWQWLLDHDCAAVIPAQVVRVFEVLPEP